MSTQSSERLGYRPALDGMRACAVLAVMAYHATVPSTWGGGLVGVETFFVLSGFLITTLLIEERERSGRIHLGNFYVRRALRLLPALFTVVAVFAAYAAAFPRDYGSPHTLSMAPSVLFYVANFRGVTNLGFFGHMWSLSLEEQFYIVWPALLILVLRLTNSYRWLFGTALCLGLASTAWRFVLAGDAPINRIGRIFDVRAAGMLFGCAAAVAYARASDEQRQRARIPLGYAATIGSGVLIALIVMKFDPRTSLRLPLLLVEFAALALILHVVASDSSRIATFLSRRRLVAIGRISYGLYLWHVPVFMLVWSTTRHNPRIVTILVDFAVAFAVAIASFKFVEEPALKLKARLARTVQLDVSAPE